MEVQATGDQKDHCPDGLDACKATSTTLGSLEQAVDGFQKSVGLSRLRPGHYALSLS